MNYRHAFHAGNFADVVKHVVLVRILLHLTRKESAFRVIDTHAGAGIYDLAGEEASRTGEWQRGIGRLCDIDRDSPAGALLAPYRTLVENDAGALRMLYPGSPVITQAQLRGQDRALFCETQADVRAALVRALGHDRRVKVPNIDGWTALGAFVPPPERRGLVLVDPPYEAPDEFSRLADGFAAAHRKWPTGVFVLWYPVKDFAAHDAMLARLTACGATNLLRIEFGIAPVGTDARLTRAGMIVANAPYTLAGEMEIILPALGAAMGQGTGASWTVAATA